MCAISLKTGQFCNFIGWTWPNEPQNDPNGLCIRIHISFELGKVSSASLSAAFFILGVKNVWLTITFLGHFYPGLLRQIFQSCKERRQIQLWQRPKCEILARDASKRQSESSRKKSRETVKAVVLAVWGTSLSYLKSFTYGDFVRFLTVEVRGDPKWPHTRIQSWPPWSQKSKLTWHVQIGQEARPLHPLFHTDKVLWKWWDVINLWKRISFANPLGGLGPMTPKMTQMDFA